MYRPCGVRPSYSIRERVSARPTLDINGMWSGWSGPGPKTIIPAKASVKLSSRLVGNQDPDKIFELLKKYIESIAPPTVKVKVSLVTKGWPALIPFDLPEMQAASRAYEKGWGHTPVFTRGGGSIPVVADIYNLLENPGGHDGVMGWIPTACIPRTSITAWRCSSAALKPPSSTWMNWRNCRADSI